MRQLLNWLFVFSICALFMAGCSGGSSNPVIPVDNDDERNIDYLPDEYCGEMTVVNLIAGQNIDVGSVKVTNDDEYLYIHFEVEEPWVIVETHVAVSDSLGGIPQTKKGNPKVGNFTYDINSWIPLTWDCDTPLYISAHAVVQMMGPEGQILQEETAWGEGDDFPGGSWAMYFMHVIQCCYKEFSIPSDAVQATFIHPGPESYWETILAGVPIGHNVWDGSWRGWCVDQGHYIQSGRTYTVYMYSSYDPALPSYAQDDDWDMVNYIINHKSTTPTTTTDDIQNAIWYFINGGYWPSDLDAQDMINDALANGEGFIPAPGEWIAIILDPVENTSGDRSQLTIIEVDP